MNSRFLEFLFVVALLPTAFAAAPAVPVRTIKNLSRFPRDTLRRELSPPLYRSIEVSPVDAWVVARAVLYSGKATSAKIVHSEAGGIYDRMVLDIANQYTTSGTNQVESRIEADTLTVHLLVFKIRDGLLAISFAHSDDARYLGYEQTGDAWVGILKNGQWKTISKPNRR